VCLTATALDTDASTFTVGLAPETLRRTYFADGTDTFGPGTAVNLERASEIGGRNSGHFVQGHVDGVGTVIDRWIDEDSLWYKVQVSPEILRYIVPKGFVAIDGTSLTVCDVDTTDNWFTFMLIEYTQKHIVVPNKLVGDKLNIETDCLGKYSESAMATLVPRIEALEGTVESLQREIADMKNFDANIMQKINEMGNGNGVSRAPRPPAVRGSTQSLGAAKPTYGGTITNWKLLPNNSITGTAMDNPEIDDGSDITSSVIVNPEVVQEGATVQTRSGILYKLGQPREAISAVQVEEVDGAAATGTANVGDMDWKPKSEGGTTIDIYKREHDGRDDIYGRGSDEKEDDGNDGADRPKLKVVGVDW
jgi:riboflavin synthase